MLLRTEEWIDLQIKVKEIVIFNIVVIIKPCNSLSYFNIHTGIMEISPTRHLNCKWLLHTGLRCKDNHDRCKTMPLNIAVMQVIVFYFIEDSGNIKTLCLLNTYRKQKGGWQLHQSHHFEISSPHSFTPSSSPSHLYSWNSWWENTVERKLCEYKPIWPDLFQWTRHFLPENLWDFPLASHRCVLHLSCDHLNILASLPHCGNKLTSLSCLYCKLIHSLSCLWLI